MKSFSGKYFKFALIILVIGIIISITAFSLGGKFINLPTHNVTDFSESYVGVESLNIELGLSNIEVKTGSEFKIVATNVSSNTFKTYVENGIWYIQDKASSQWFNVNFNIDNNNKVIIYIPESFKSDKLKINIGAGQLIGEKLVARSTDIKVGAGNLKISDLTTDEINVDCGVGNIEINGQVNNKANLECGIGNMELNLKGNEKDYNYNLDVGIGSVILNDNDFSGSENRVIDNKSDKLFKIECGIGKVSLNINE